jgi:hypothetical protein
MHPDMRGKGGGAPTCRCWGGGEGGGTHLQALVVQHARLLQVPEVLQAPHTRRQLEAAGHGALRGDAEGGGAEAEGETVSGLKGGGGRQRVRPCRG